MIGINFYDKFLLPPGEQGKRRATLKDVSRHVRHICDVVGTRFTWGWERTWMEAWGGSRFRSRSKRPRIWGEWVMLSRLTVSADEDVAAVLGGNWVRYFKRRVQLRHDR